MITSNWTQYVSLVVVVVVMTSPSGTAYMGGQMSQRDEEFHQILNPLRIQNLVEFSSQPWVSSSHETHTATCLMDSLVVITSFQVSSSLIRLSLVVVDSHFIDWGTTQGRLSLPTADVLSTIVKLSMLTDVDKLSSCSRFSDSVVGFTGQKTQPTASSTEGSKPSFSNTVSSRF